MGLCVTVRAFYCHSQLHRRMNCVNDDDPLVQVDASELLSCLLAAQLQNDTVWPAVQRLLAEDDGALCCVRLSSLIAAHWCFLLLAVPDALTAAQVMGQLRDDFPLQPQPLSESGVGGSRCGLWIELGLRRSCRAS
jgi:hypothetical protein